MTDKPNDADMPERVIDESDRIVAHRGIDVVCPQPAVLEEVLVRVDDAHIKASLAASVDPTRSRLAANLERLKRRSPRNLAIPRA